MADEAPLVFPWGEYDRYVVAPWLILAPTAVVIARNRDRIPHAITIHRSLQWLTWLFTLIAFALAVRLCEKFGIPNFDEPHTRLGLVIFILATIQAALGGLAHALFKADRTKRPLQNVAHIVLGVSLIILGFVQVPLGFWCYPRVTPAQVWAMYGLLVGFFILYPVGLVSLILNRRREGHSWLNSAFGLGRDVHQIEAIPHNGIKTEDDLR